MKSLISLTINQKEYELAVEPSQILADLLRDRLNLLGVKKGCGLGECGACTILLDGKPVSSCIMLAIEAHGREIVTIEGLETENGLHPIQQAFVEKGAIQCGFCTAGMEMSALNLLSKNTSPTEEEIRRAISGNLCRCTGYYQIVDAIEDAAQRMKGEVSQ